MNYNTLMNKPTINYRELIGDNTVTEVGGITEEQFNTLLTTDLSSYYTKAEIDDLFSRSYVYREKSGSIVTFDCPSTSQSIPSLTVGIEATQSGSGDPSPTNVRPISGWSAVNVYDTGINIWDEEWESGRISSTTGQNTVGEGGIRSKNYINVSSTQSYYFKFPLNTSDAQICYYRSDFSFIGTSGWRKSGLISLPTDCCYIRFYTSSNYMTYNNDISINYPSTDTEYHAYNGTTYTTALKDENDQPLTCYGGQLENVNGVQTLTVTHANIASYNGETINEPWISSMDVYSEGATPTTGAQVVYPLTTPTEIPQQSQAISTQSGTNNLWADSGDVEVKCLDRIIPAGE